MRDRNDAGGIIGWATRDSTTTNNPSSAARAATVVTTSGWLSPMLDDSTTAIGMTFAKWNKALLKKELVEEAPCKAYHYRPTKAASRAPPRSASG